MKKKIARTMCESVKRDEVSKIRRQNEQQLYGEPGTLFEIKQTQN